MPHKSDSKHPQPETKPQSFAIRAQSLTRRFGDFTAVSAVTFDVRYGEIFGFLGPNGSGKTTTIRTLLGLLSPSEGSIELLGERVDGGTAHLRARIGYMAQRFSLYNDLTVLQNLRFYGRAYGLENDLLKERIDSALELAGLSGHEHTRTGELAGGWRQRLALSAAILHRPEVLFLDEPTAGVDPLSRRAFWDLLYRLVQEGVTVFVTTHYMDEAEHCHRLAFIQHGNIIAMGSPSQIKRELMTGQVYEFEPSDPIAALKCLRAAKSQHRLDLEEVELYGSFIHLITTRTEESTRPIEKELERAGITPGVIRPMEASLEDVFIACMRR